MSINKNNEETVDSFTIEDESNEEYEAEMDNEELEAQADSEITEAGDAPLEVRNNISEINYAKEITQRLLKYAIENPEIDATKEMLATIIPVLRKNSAEFTSDDEVVLWTSYNELTDLVAPASNLSLIIADKLNEELGFNVKKPSSLLKLSKTPNSPLSGAIKECRSELRTVFLYLISTVFLYIVVQGYCGMLSTAISNVDNTKDAWVEQQKVMSDLRVAGSEQLISSNDTNKAEYLTDQLGSSTKFLSDLTKPLFIFSKGSSPVEQSCNKILETKKDANYLKNSAMCITFQRQYASSFYTILSEYLLPLILGVLGATAFVVRNTLEKLKTNSYLPGASGRLSMRLCLGGLLGVISGIFITSGPEAMASFNLNLVMISLVMGYSVEVAFSLFDGVVFRMRQWTESLKK